jgi:hypothetical protein
VPMSCQDSTGKMMTLYYKTTDLISPRSLVRAEHGIAAVDILACITWPLEKAKLLGSWV